MYTYLSEGTLAYVIKDADAPADPEAVSIASLTDAVNVSEQLVVGSFNANFLDPDTSDERNWATKGKSQDPTIDNYEVGGIMIRDRDNVGVLTTKDPLKLFGHREVVWFLIRYGLPEDVNPAVGQDYGIFKVMITKRNPLPNPDGGTEKIEIGTLPRGYSAHGVFVA